MSGPAIDGLRAGTEVRILEGALEAVGRHGFRKLAMTDVSAQAGVSRGTVYRYFATREELLAALARYEQHRYERGLEQALQGSVPGGTRITATIEYAFAYFADHPVGNRLVESEPAFVLEYVSAQLPVLKRSLLERLRPDLEQTAMVRQGILSADQFADLLIRLLLSMFLVPPESPDSMRAALRTIVERG